MAKTKTKPKGVIFRASTTTKSGKKIYAKDYGKKAFPIKVKK